MEKGVEEVFNGTKIDLIPDIDLLVKIIIEYLNQAAVQNQDKVIQIELICNAGAVNRQQAMKRLFKKLLSISVKRYAQMCHWFGNGFEGLLHFTEYVEQNSAEETEVRAIVELM